MMTWMGALQAAAPQGVRQVHDSLSVDSIRMDTPPLPMGPVAQVFRFLFSGVPQWVQIGGVVLGVIVAIVVVTMAVRHRRAIVAWLSAKSHGYKVALGAGVGGTMLAVGLVGGWSYNYMMHENDFCSSCHVMKSAFGKFQESEHSKLECHACHQQSIFASARELYYWVMDRPEEIPAHSPVPNQICADCHITEKRDSVWQRVSATAGHQVHLKSDSSSLRDVMCVTCHAREVHAFQSTDLSCGQSGCHENQEIKLGAMANQTSLHCITCHEFARPVSETISLDSTKQELVPVKPQCFSCHEMREKLAERGLDKDPHKASCGACHNPHVQEKAAGAIKSCATSECHASADTLTAFHRGLGTHVIDNCVACHEPHSWKVESTSCIGCHKNIFDERGGAARRSTPTGRPAGQRPAPSQAPGSTVGPTTAAPYVPHASPRPPRRSGPSAEGDEPPDWYGVASHTPAPVVAMPKARGVPAAPSLAAEQLTVDAPRDTAVFSHARHRKVACEKCHDSSDRHGAVVVNTRAACQGCHHASDQRAGTCESCHAPGEVPIKATSVVVRVAKRPTDVTRTLPFDHRVHEQSSCAECHEDSVARSVVKTCASCHASHHTVERSCASCHPPAKAEHDRLAHDGCASCHTDATVAALPPARALCLSCHADLAAHKPGKECAACHRVSWNEVKHPEERR